MVSFSFVADRRSSADFEETSAACVNHYAKKDRTMQEIGGRDWEGEKKN